MKPLQDEQQRTSLIERLDRQLHEALAERDRLAEVAEELYEAFKHHAPGSRRVGALAAYEALKEEAKAQAPKPHEQ